MRKLKQSLLFGFVFATALSLESSVQARGIKPPPAMIEVHVYPHKLTPKDKLSVMGKDIEIKSETTFVWVDLHPQARFAHATELLLITSEGTQVVKANWWPTINGVAFRPVPKTGRAEPKEPKGDFVTIEGRIVHLRGSLAVSFGAYEKMCPLEFSDKFLYAAIAMAQNSRVQIKGKLSVAERPTLVVYDAKVVEPTLAAQSIEGQVEIPGILMKRPDADISGKFLLEDLSTIIDWSRKSVAIDDSIREQLMKKAPQLYGQNVILRARMKGYGLGTRSERYEFVIEDVRIVTR